MTLEKVIPEIVDVAEDYDQSFINIKFKGASKLSDKSEKVQINDRTFTYSHSKEFGPYPKQKI